MIPPKFWHKPKALHMEIVGGGRQLVSRPASWFQAAEQAEKDVLREKEVMQFCCWAVACLERMVSTCFCVVFWCFLHSGIGISPKCVFWWGTMFFGTIWYYFRRRVPRYCSSWNSSTSESSAQDKRYPPLTHGFPKGREKGSRLSLFHQWWPTCPKKKIQVYYILYIYSAHLFAISCIISGVYYMWIFHCSRENIMWIYLQVLYMIWHNTRIFVLVTLEPQTALQKPDLGPSRKTGSRNKDGNRVTHHDPASRNPKSIPGAPLASCEPYEDDEKDNV